MDSRENPFRRMAEKWPSTVVARTEVPKFTGGLVSEKYIANMDAQKKGPAGRIRTGRKVCYPLDSLIEWLEGRSIDLE